MGNNTYHHRNGWHTETEDYLADVEKCDAMISSQLFRPPYGKLKPSQSAALKANKKIIMWDILSGDFDQTITKEKCLANVMDNYTAGSVIVFHDNIKAQEKLQFVLPLFLEHLAQQGFVSSHISVQVEEYA